MMSPTIVHLNLANNPFGPKGAASLVKAASTAASIQNDRIKLAKAAFIQAEKNKQVVQDLANQTKVPKTGKTGKRGKSSGGASDAASKPKQKYSMKPGAMVVLASVRFDKDEKKKKRLRGDTPITLLIGKVAPTMNETYLHNTWFSSNSYSLDLSRPGQRYAMELLRQRGLNLGAKLRNCVVDEFNEIRPPARKNDPCWGNKLPSKGKCVCKYMSPIDVAKQKRKDEEKAYKSAEPEREATKMTAKQRQALEVALKKQEEHEVNSRVLDASLTPRAVAYVDELEAEGHLDHGAVVATTSEEVQQHGISLPHLISHTAMPFLETLRYKFGLMRANDRAVVHRLLEHAQFISNRNTTSVVPQFWSMKNVHVGGKKIRAAKLLEWASDGLPVPGEKETLAENQALFAGAMGAMMIASSGSSAEKQLLPSPSVSNTKKDTCTFDLVLAHDQSRIHVLTMAMDLNLEKNEGKNIYRTLFSRQMHRPGEKWWAPTPRNLTTAAALSHHPGCSGKSLAHGPNIPHQKRFRFLYTVTTGSNTSSQFQSEFVPFLRRERYTFDLEDDIQHNVALHLLDRASAHKCYQEWIVEAMLDNGQLAPILVADMFGFGAGRKHLPVFGKLILTHVHLISEPIISEPEFALLLDQIRAQERDLDRLALIRESTSRGLEIEHVAAMLQPFVHIDRALSSLAHLCDRGAIVSEHSSSVVRVLTHMEKHLVSGVARFIKLYACDWREVECLMPEETKEAEAAEDQSSLVSQETIVRHVWMRKKMSHT
jgi:hypothetical protein